MEPEFFRTRMGRQFYEHTMPELVRQVGRVADALERGSPVQPDPVQSPSGTFEPGQRVVINYNPHHPAASEIVGEVIEFRPGAGFMGCDLVEVRYTLPRDGTVHDRPFAADALSRGDREALLARAGRHEEQAARLRAMADEVTR